MKIRTATWDELLAPPSTPKYTQTNDTHCWCARPGGCETKLEAGPAGRLCDICAEDHHPAYDPKDFT